MNKNGVWQIAIMCLVVVLIMVAFLGALWIGLKLGLSSREAMIELKGVGNGNYERF